MSAYFSHRMSVEQFRQMDVIDLAALAFPALIEGREDADNEFPVAVIVPYSTYVIWQETISKAQKYSADLKDACEAAFRSALRAETPVRHEAEESPRETV